MATFLHPVTNELLEFEDVGKATDWLLLEFTKRSSEEKIAGDEKRTFAKFIDSICPNQTKLSGTVTVEGENFVGKVVRGQTVKYLTLTSLEDPLLQQVYTQVEQSREVISLKFTEKTAAMEKFLGSVVTDPTITPEQSELLRKLEQSRTYQKSAPQVSVTAKE